MDRKTAFFDKIIISLIALAFLFGFSDLSEAAFAKGLLEGLFNQKKASPVELDMVPSVDAILIPVDFDGKQYLFLLDTGATLNGLDLSLCKNLKGKLVDSAIDVYGQKKSSQTYSSPDMKVGNLSMKRDGRVSGDDYSGWREIMGQEVYGVIGMATLKKYIVQIDFDQNKVKFMHKKTSLERSEIGEEFYLHYSDGDVPYILINMNRFGRIEWTIDSGTTGSRAGSLPFPIFNKLHQELDFKTISTSSLTTFNERISCRTARIPHFSIGELEYKNLIFYENNRAFLGLDFLKRHLVTFDFPNKKIYLKPGKNFAKTTEIDMSGLGIGFDKERKDVLVKEVRMKSPAEESGFIKGDIILGIDKNDIARLSLDGIRALLSSGDGSVLNVLIKRGQTERNLQLELKREL